MVTLAGLATRSSPPSSTPTSSATASRRSCSRSGERAALPHRRGPHPHRRPGAGDHAQPAGSRVFPFRAAAIVYIDVMRGLPSILVIYMLGLGIPALGIEVSRPIRSSGPRGARRWSGVAYVAEVYRAGIESVHPSQDAAARSLGLCTTQSMRYVVAAAGRPPCRPAAAQRLHRPHEGHRPDLVHRRRSRPSVAPRSPMPRRSTSRRILVSALIFLLLTIPMARFVDWLVARDRRRQMAGAR